MINLNGALLGEKADIVVQEKPTGMGDAVLLAEEKVQTPNCLIVWGDQVMLNVHTVEVCATLHEAYPVANLTLPGDFAFETFGTEVTGNGITTSLQTMQPRDPSLQNRRREASARVGLVTVSIS